MADRSIPTPDELRQLLRYEARTGKLFWMPRPVSVFRSDSHNTVEARQRQWNTRYGGREAGTPDKNGYLCVNLAKRQLKAHRIIWAIHYSEWPSVEIDHINGNPSDNRIENLRLADRSSNTINTKSHRDSASKYKGVSWHSQSKKWRAQINIAGQYRSLGLYRTEEDAALAYNNAASKHGTEFVRLNTLEG